MKLKDSAILKVSLAWLPATVVIFGHDRLNREAQMSPGLSDPVGFDCSIWGVEVRIDLAILRS